MMHETETREDAMQRYLRSERRMAAAIAYQQWRSRGLQRWLPSGLRTRLFGVFGRRYTERFLAHWAIVRRPMTESAVAVLGWGAFQPPLSEARRIPPPERPERSARRLTVGAARPIAVFDARRLPLAPPGTR